MKKHFYLFIACFSTLFCSAQYHYTPNDTIHVSHSVTDQFEEVDAYIYLHNNTDSGITVIWSVIKDSITDGWDIGLCDNIQCYDNGLNRLYNDHVSDVVDNGDSVFLKAVFYPYCNTGSGMMRVIARIDGSTNNPDTLTYFVTSIAECATGINDLGNGQAVNVFPNPTTDVLTVSGILTQQLIQLTDMQGRIIQSLNYNDTDRRQVNVTGIATGMYLLKVSDAQGNAVAVKKFSKL